MNVFAHLVNHIETQFLLLKEFKDDPSYDEEVPFDDSLMDAISDWVCLKLGVYDEKELVEKIAGECYFELLNGQTLDNLNVEHMYRSMKSQ